MRGVDLRSQFRGGLGRNTLTLTLPPIDIHRCGDSGLAPCLRIRGGELRLKDLVGHTTAESFFQALSSVTNNIWLHRLQGAADRPASMTPPSSHDGQLEFTFECAV